jgi:hypothetical protein
LETEREGIVTGQRSFEIGKFYQHRKGRYIAPLGIVKTYKWGEQLVVEETDKTGHSISCVGIGAECNENWIEIGRDEWLRNFNV